MQRFSSNGVEIAYHVEGEGKPVLLVHGFASNWRVNWQATGWVKWLMQLGHTVVAFDNRGHGESEKLYDPAKYEAPEMAEDARRLLDHLGIVRADVMGYSMGARISAFLAINHPDRVGRAVLAGLAENIFRGVGNGELIAGALETENIDDVSSPVALAFRRFAEQTKADRRALAACMRAGRPAITTQELAGITAPVLVVVGENDEVAGAPEPLVDSLPNGRAVVLPGRDHMKAVGDRGYKQAVSEFLSET